jgi:type II secretory pathway pseudopilin PulG
MTRRGISLLEAVVAIAIVGMTSVAALESVGGGMRAAERSRHAIEAEALATAEREFMNMLTDRELQALPDSVSSGKFPVPMDAYTWTASSTPVAEQAGVYDVRVIVKWDEGTYTLRSYQYRLPPLVTRR